MIRSGLLRSLAVIAVSSLLGACAPQVSVNVMMMGPRFEAKPESCEILFTRADTTTINLTHHIIAQIRVSGIDPKGGMLSDEFTPEVRGVLGPAACRLGADTVVPAMSFGTMGGYGAYSSIGFYILKKRTTPLVIPPGMMPPGMMPPGTQPPAPPTPKPSSTSI